MIKSFSGEFRWLSSFWPVKVQWLGREWPSVEHAYQASKASSPEEIEAIAACETPGRAKRAARKFKLRESWEAERVGIMRALIEQKFAEPELRAKLLATGSEQIQEGNTWGDTFWGVCKGEGQNKLGQLLMEARQKIKEEQSG